MKKNICGCKMLFSVKFVPLERVKYLRCEILLYKCEIRLRRVKRCGGEALFHIHLMRSSNFTICRANYFTVSEANSNISERKRHHRAHSVGVIEQYSDLGYTVYINR